MEARSLYTIPHSTISTPLTSLLEAEIRAHGPISFREFMERALYTPELGNYASGRARLGREGDYFTNVSVGPLFGTLLARQFAEMWERLGRPTPFTIVEQGAHRGEFARDTLRALRDVAPACFEAAVYWVVEPFEPLRAAQQEALAEFARVRWVTGLATLDPFTGVHFSNELLDAMPVHRVVRRADGWRETYVQLHKGRFSFVDGPLSHPELATFLDRLPPLSADYQTEVNLAALSWIAELATKLECGYVLAFDYGFSRAEYYRPERAAGTLSAYSQHRRVADLLERPGEIDLTAHIDFTSLTERAEQAALSLAGFCDQHRYMVGLGRLHFHDTPVVSAAHAQELRAFQTLMHPGLMGAAFKVVCWEKGVAPDATPAGFQFGPEPRRQLGLI